MKVMRVGTAEAAPGHRADGVLRVARLADASWVEIPVCILHGKRPGIRMWAQSGVHGNEYVGMAAMHRLRHEIDPAEMTGSIVLMPMVNILAYRSMARSAPQDGLDMNRIWPGADLGRAWHIYAHSELVVHAIWQEMRANADIVVDCHAGGWQNLMASWAAFIRDPERDVCRESERLALVTGVDIVWSRAASFVAERTPGSLLGHLMRENIPSVVIEAGGEGRAAPEAADVMHRALLNIARASGILPGEPEVPRPPGRVNSGHWVRAAEGGMWRLATKLMAEVDQGETLGVITDLHGTAVQKVHAPASGIVIGLRTLAVVNSGEYLANVAQTA